MIKKICTVLLSVFFAYGQAQNLTIDEAIAESMRYFSTKMTAKTKVVVLNIESESKNLSDYIIDESSVFIMNNTKLSLVDKSKLPIIMQEKNIGDLNEIDENTALEIGKKLGASGVIFGSISKLSANFRFRVQALNTADGRVFGMQSLNVKEDEILADLLGMEFSRPQNSAQKNISAISQTPPAANPRDVEFNELQNLRQSGFSDSQSARARLEAETNAKSPQSLQSANNQNQNDQVIVVRDTIYQPAPQTANSALKRSQVFLAYRWQGSVSPGAFYSGTEFEIGGVKRGKLLFTGITNFSYSTGLYENGGGGGGGVFIAPIISAGEVFKFAPGMDVGFWYYDSFYDDSFYD